MNQKYCSAYTDLLQSGLDKPTAIFFFNNDDGALRGYRAIREAG
jgi:DNA-binding LacI/PurR family transcriptional regulator